MNVNTPGLGIPVEDLEDLFENAPCGYVSMQSDGRVVKINRTALDWLGSTAEDVVGKRFRDLLSVAGRIYYETHFIPNLRMQGNFNEVAFDLLTSDGGRLPVLANAAERRADDGTLLFTRVTLFKATERRRFERQLIDARATADAARAAVRSELEIEQQNAELRDQFIAVLGHDLRNPVASVNAAARMLRAEVTTDKAIRILDLMQGSVVRMGGLIDNVLDFARGRLGGGITLDLGSDELLEPMLRQVVDELQSVHPGREINSVWEFDGPVSCDRNRVGQMLSNLLGNAISHGAHDLPVRVSGRSRNGSLELWVANSGPVIPAARIARLFEPFYRGVEQHNLQGLGLGLHIAFEIARAHQGQLTVSSDEHETRFTFSMPSSPLSVVA